MNKSCEYLHCNTTSFNGCRRYVRRACGWLLQVDNDFPEKRV